MSFIPMSKILRTIKEDIVRGLPRTPTPPASQAAAEHPTIRNCKILGFQSRNNRVYTREAVSKAASKYEGVKVNLDHNTGTDPRKFSERFGRMVNVRMTPEGLYGDLQYNPKHPVAEAFRWWVANDPNAIGLSHNATAEVQTTAQGHELVTEIREVDSVDLVADPATTKGLLESYQERNTMDPLADEQLPPPTEPPVQDAQPAPVTEDEGDGDFAAHLGNAILAIINDPAMSAGDKKKKVLQALKLIDDGEGEGDTGEEAAPVLETDEDSIILPPDEEEVEEGDTDEEAAMEAAFLGSDEDPEPIQKTEEAVNPELAKLRAELDAYRVKEALGAKKARAIRACKEAKLPSEAVTQVFLGQLMQVKEAAWGKLVADRKAIARRTTKPISASAAVAGDNYESFVRDLFAL